ncbi:hypothetical protein [Yersinia rohdei]|uniref:hypothetical protein n=1 Tax=Yersinia rohdei TaxID=29485 RepID=UPI0011A1ACAC|nr:hypothetical protein [Yersinia rohdei]
MSAKVDGRQNNARKMATSNGINGTSRDKICTLCQELGMGGNALAVNTTVTLNPIPVDLTVG